MMKAIKKGKAPAGILPAKWEPLARDLKVNEDIVKRAHPITRKPSYGVVTGGFGCRRSSLGSAVFVEVTDTLEDAQILQDERMNTAGTCDFRSLPANRFRSERWERHDIEAVMIHAPPKVPDSKTEKLCPRCDGTGESKRVKHL